MSEYLRDSDVWADEDLARATVLPDFDLQHFAEDAMSADTDRPTPEIPEEKLKVLVAKSTPPASGVIEPTPCVNITDVEITEKEDRASSAPPLMLARRWSAHH